MPEYRSPGVYVEEWDTGRRPIEGVGTALAAFVGFAPSGTTYNPRLISNWTQYLEEFALKDDKGNVVSEHHNGYYLSHAVRGYFDNGGGRCYVVRIQPPVEQRPNRQPFLIPSKDDENVKSLGFTLKDGVDSAVEITVGPAAVDNPGDDHFSLSIRLVSEGEPETYPDLTFGRNPRSTSVVDRLATSRLVMYVEQVTTASPTVARTPKHGTYTVAPPAIESESTVEHFKGARKNRTGVEGLQVASDVTMLCCPDLMYVYQQRMEKAEEAEKTDQARADEIRKQARAFVNGVQEAMITHCTNMGDRVAILDPLPGQSVEDMIEWRDTDGLGNFDSKYAAVYYPWIKVTVGPGKQIAIPPSGHIAGIYARNDVERGVHKAPANEVVRGATNLEMEITKGEQDELNPKGINCIRSFPGRGIRVWGARTLSKDQAWKYVNVRRLFNYIEKSIEQGTQWVVFEPNDMDLWARVRRDVSAFLTVAWRDGMLFGANPTQAFFVRCDEELNPVESRDLGRLIVEVGIAPVKPAEFVIFRVSQWDGGSAQAVRSNS